jgi:Mrp family chromosome partitioning ATPase
MSAAPPVRPDGPIEHDASGEHEVLDMTTNPRRSAQGTSRASDARRTGAPGSPRPDPSDAGLDRIAGPDGRLSLLDDAGQPVQVAAAGVVESLRYMLGRLRLGDDDEFPERLGITSAISGEGVTFVTRSLALVLTTDVAKRVCIVDLNWWSRSDWPGEDVPGVADVVRDGLPLEQALHLTGNPGLHILPAGTASVVERPALARSSELTKVLDELNEEFEHVLLDLPAIHATSEALMLAENCPSLALVVSQNVTPDSEVKSALEEIDGVPLLGVILNRSYSKIPRFIRNRIPGA